MSCFFNDFSFQVARVLHLLYRLVVQPNTSKAHTFAEAFIACGGVETLLVLLQREAKTGDSIVPESMTKTDESPLVQEPELDRESGDSEKCPDDEIGYNENEPSSSMNVGESETSKCSISPATVSQNVKIERTVSVSDYPFIRNLGDISLSISADSARNNVYNVDKSDGIVVGIIGLLGALVASGHLRFDSRSLSDATTNLLGTGLHDGAGTMFDDKVSLLLFALHKAFQASPKRLMTGNVYTALLGASVSSFSHICFH